MPAALAVAAGVVALLALARLAVRVVTVSGTSMEPGLLAGSRVLALRRWPRRWLRPGQVVLLRGMRGAGPDGLMVKRIARLLTGPEDRSYVRLDGPWMAVDHARATMFVLGDNPESTDSRRWGPVPVEAVAGLVLTWSAVPPPRP
jgi:signal peptidase I